MSSNAWYSTPPASAASSMEKLVDSGQLAGVIDLTTTEVCDLLMGGVFPATEDRFGAIIRSRVPYVGSVGALDMVNFGAPDTIPERYRQRKFHVHNPQVTLMRTTPEENERMGKWIGERLNQMDGPVRFLLPEGGVSALDAPGQPFRDADADAALFQRAGAHRAPDRQPPTHSRSKATSTIPNSPPLLSARSVPCSDAPARGGEW